MNALATTPHADRMVLTSARLDRLRTEADDPQVHSRTSGLGSTRAGTPTPLLITEPRMGYRFDVSEEVS